MTSQAEQEGQCGCCAIGCMLGWVLVLTAGITPLLRAWLLSRHVPLTHSRMNAVITAAFVMSVLIMGLLIGISLWRELRARERRAAAPPPDDAGSGE